MNSADKSLIAVVAIIAIAILVDNFGDSVESMKKQDQELKMAEIGYDQIYDKESGKVLWQKSGVKKAQDENSNP